MAKFVYYLLAEDSDGVWSDYFFAEHNGRLILIELWSSIFKHNAVAIVKPIPADLLAEAEGLVSLL